MLPISNTHFFVIVTAVGLVLFVLEQVRRRRLREEYSWLWLVASTINLMIAISPEIMRWVANFLGTANATLTFVFIGLQFLVLILIQYSVRLSQLSTQVKNLAQQVAILDEENHRFAGSTEGKAAASGSPTTETSSEAEKKVSEKVEAVNHE